MKDRSFNIALVDFDPEIVGWLSSIIGLKPEATDCLLKAIRLPLTLFIGELEMLKEDPILAPSTRIKNHCDIEKHASALGHLLNDLDPMSDYFKVVQALASQIERNLDLPDISELEGEEWLNASLCQEIYAEDMAEEALSELQNSLRHLARGMALHNKFPRRINQGRQPNFREAQLIREISLKYRDQTGSLPSSAKEGNYHAFLIAVFNTVGIKKSDCSHLLKIAISSITD